jgi:hypothetical protein
MLNRRNRGVGTSVAQRIIEIRFSSPAEALMRAAIVALVAVSGLIALAAPAPAAPSAPPGITSAPPIALVRDGCGAGWHAQTWRDRWGNMHRRCVPNRW